MHSITDKEGWPNRQTTLFTNSRSYCVQYNWLKMTSDQNTKTHPLASASI